MTDVSDRPKGSSLGPLRALVPYIRPYKRTLYLALAALLLAAGAQLSLPVALRYLIDLGLLADNADTIDRYFLALFGVAVAFGLFSAFRFYLVTWIGERVVVDLRTEVFSQLTKLSLSFYEITRTGEVLSRLTADTTQIKSAFGVPLRMTQPS